MKESGEMYLETIHILSQEQKNVRAIDIVERMNFSKPSVSRALSKLRQNNCVTVDENGFVSLTEKGAEIAVKIFERHKILSEFLQMLGVSEENATADACKIEHDISDESFDAIRNHFQIK